MNQLIVEILQHVHKYRNECNDGAVAIHNPKGYTPQEIVYAIDCCKTAGYLEVVAISEPMLDGVAGSIKLTKQGEDYLHAQLRA